MARSILSLYARLFRKVVVQGGVRRELDEPVRDPKSLAQVAMLVGTAAILTNVAFYILAGKYFEDRSAIYGGVTPEQVAGVRLAFGVFTGSVAVASIVAAWQPMLFGHIVTALASIAALIAGVSAAKHDMTAVLPVSLLVSSAVLGTLTWKSLDRSRPAWAFLVGMTSILSAVLLFGATKVRGALDVGLWTALIIPGLLVVATVALTLVRDEYRDA